MASDADYWMQTFTGREFRPFDPRPEDVCIEDIAHSLALQNRFAGHTSEPYSVAEHCVRASRLPASRFFMDTSLDWSDWSIAAVVRGEILMHDASEAYVVDLPQPLKRHLAFAPYHRVEVGVMRTIAQALSFGQIVISFQNDLVKRADAIMLATEFRDLMRQPPPRDWLLIEQPDEERIVPWSWQRAEQEFLARYKELGGKS